MSQVTEVVKIRRKVFAELARMAFAGTLEKDIATILNTVVTEEGPRYRCCVHKERAVLHNRINLALSQPMTVSIAEAASAALQGNKATMPVVNVLPEACDQCPIDKFLVTDACRNCIAHNCMAACPKKAIHVVLNRAYIDKNKCVECGLCKKSCEYGAIIEISRPCERACDLGAIKAGADRRAVIDYEKCVQCGACKTTCPFGAVGDKSFIVQLIQTLKAGKRVYAILAPAFIGQFGFKVKPGQVVEALKKMGFHDVYEASFGADLVTMTEAKELAETLAENPKSFLTTSCCPAFAGMVQKHMPEIANRVSTTVSPMVATGKIIRDKDPEAVTVFIGPCVAKKAEAEETKGIIDYVFTFEELAAMMVGAGINLAEVENTDYHSTASRDGNGFACAGGVTCSVIDTAAIISPEVKIIAQCGEGLSECQKILKQIQSGQISANFFEGMACVGGCVGGPSVMADRRVTGKLVAHFAAEAFAEESVQNKPVSELLAKGGHWHRIPS